MENQLQTHRDTISDLQKDLELKISGAKASDMCLSSEVSYLETRISDLERELAEKNESFNLQQAEMQKLEVSMKEEICKLECQLQDTTFALSASASSLMTQTSSKDSEIEQLKKDIESLSSSDASSREMISEKNNEIQTLMEQTTLKDDRLKELECLLEKKAEALANIEQDKSKLQEALESLKQECEESSKKQTEDVQKKDAHNFELEKKIEVLLSEVSVLKVEVERYQGSSNDADLSLRKSLEVEESLKKQISELAESQVKLKSDAEAKDSQCEEITEQLKTLKKEIEERDKCIAGLEAEVKSMTKQINDKESSIAKWTTDFNELQAKTQRSIDELEGLKQTVDGELVSAQRSFEETKEKLKTTHEAEKSSLSGRIDELTKALKDKESLLEKNEKNAELLAELKASLEEKLATKENDIKELTTKLNKAERDGAEQVS